MKLVGAISTAVLSMVLGVAAPLFAQEQHEREQQKPETQDQRAQPEKTAKQEQKPVAQQEKKAQQEENNNKPEEKNAKQEETNVKPEKNAKQEGKNTKPAKENAQQEQHAGNNGGGRRIPEDKFKANFGQQHSFRVSENDYRNHRFQYGGYSFGFVDPWPSNWLYTQNVYVIEINGVYYLCNASFPGVNLVLSFTL